MSLVDFDIKIFENFENEELADAWHRLEKEGDIFPQMYLAWIEPWWRYNASNRRLHIVALVDTTNLIIAIAPFCIENKSGLKVLITIPIHFGDFYYIITNEDNLNLVSGKILEYCKSFKYWNLVQLNQVDVSSQLFIEAKNNNAVYKKLSDVVCTNLDYSTFSEFLGIIGGKERREFKRRRKRLEEIGDVRLSLIKSKEDYHNYEIAMKNIAIKKWKGKANSKTDKLFRYRAESYANCLDLNKALGFILLLNSQPIAYRLGFINNDEFISWKLVYDPDFSSLGLGKMISIMSIEQLINMNIKALNNGGGDYEYKKSWFTNEKTSEIYRLFLKNNNLRAAFYIFIEMKVKILVKRLFKI
jgi:CelD/BcsL family acetyltransferase involved in cellulose biosynthesis